MKLPGLPKIFRRDPNNPQSGKQQKLMIAIVILVALSVIIGGFSLLGGGESTKTKLQTVIAQQNEMLRILGEFENTPRTSRGQNFLREAQAILSSNSTQLTEYLQTQYNAKIDKKHAEKAKNDQIVAQLQQASQTNTFDDTLINSIEELLKENQILLSEMYEATSKEDFRQLLNTVYENQKGLLQLAQNS